MYFINIPIVNILSGKNMEWITGGCSPPLLILGDHPHSILLDKGNYPWIKGLSHTHSDALKFGIMCTSFEWQGGVGDGGHSPHSPFEIPSFNIPPYNIWKSLSRSIKFCLHATCMYHGRHTSSKFDIPIILNYCFFFYFTTVSYFWNNKNFNILWYYYIFSATQFLVILVLTFFPTPQMNYFL